MANLANIVLTTLAQGANMGPVPHLVSYAEQHSLEALCSEIYVAWSELLEKPAIVNQSARTHTVIFVPRRTRASTETKQVRYESAGYLSTNYVFALFADAGD